MTERTYTREDMARARQEGRAEGWDEGHEDGIAYARLCAVLDGEVPSIDNPYREQEEA